MASRIQTCPKCRALLEPGRKTCPYCDADQRGQMGLSERDDATATTRLGTWLLVANGIIFFLTIQLDPERGDLGGEFRPSHASLVGFGANNVRQIDECGQRWRLVTANFLHVDLLHLIFNSVAIFLLIPLAAVTLGAHRTFCIYCTAGLIGFVASHLGGNNSVGASAALSGLIAALALYGKRRGAPALTRQMLMWGGFILLFGFLSSASEGLPPIDNLGHIGGFVGGAAFGWPAASVRSRGSREDRLWRSASLGWLAAICIVVAVWQVPSIVRLMGRRDVIVYKAELDRTVELMRAVADGGTPPGKLPDSFPAGPADSKELAVVMQKALDALRNNPAGAELAFRDARLARIDWIRRLACSHNLRYQ